MTLYDLERMISNATRDLEDRKIDASKVEVMAYEGEDEGISLSLNDRYVGFISISAGKIEIVA